MTPDMLSRAGLDPVSLAKPHLMLDDSRPGFLQNSHDVCLMRGGETLVVASCGPRGDSTVCAATAAAGALVASSVKLPPAILLVGDYSAKTRTGS